MHHRQRMENVPTVVRALAQRKPAWTGSCSMSVEISYRGCEVKKFRLQRFYFSVASVFRCRRSVWIISVSVMYKKQMEEENNNRSQHRGCFIWTWAEAVVSLCIKLKWVNMKKWEFCYTQVIMQLKSSGLMWITEQLDAFNLTSSNEANRLTSNLPAYYWTFLHVEGGSGVWMSLVSKLHWGSIWRFSSLN